MEFRECRLADSPASELLREFEVYIASIIDGFNLGDGPSATQSDFDPPKGAFFVGVTPEGAPVCCGGVKRCDGFFEIKRMYVRPEFRGKGHGSTLLSHLEKVAVTMGAAKIRLDTGDKQPAAKAMYLKAAYKEIPDYNGNPFAKVWFEKDTA